MRIALGSDEDAPVVSTVVDHLRRGGHEVEIISVSEPWPSVGRQVGRAVATGLAERGVVCCWTGTGVSIAANKVPGVRAALCADAQTAEGARRWNDANVLALSLRTTTDALAAEIVDAFLSAEADPAEAVHISGLE